MAAIISNPSLNLNSRNASKIDIDAALQNLPRYKAIILIENSFQHSMTEFAKSLDITDLMHLLKCVKNHKKIHPTIMEMKRPIPVDGTKFCFTMKINFIKQAEQIRVNFHIVYNNREHILHSSSRPTNKEEQAYIKIIQTIEKNYEKL